MGISIFVPNGKEVLYLSKKTKLILMAFITVIVLIVGGLTAYVQIKYYTAKKGVKEHLLTEENIPEKEILEMEPFIANLPGDENWGVYVKLKHDEGKFFYYYDRKAKKAKILGYSYKGKHYLDPAEVPEEVRKR